MRKRTSRLPKPTPAELEILRILWRLGSATVRQVHAEIGRSDVGYTTVLKFMQIMAEKGLVERDDSERAHIYRAAVSQEQTQRQIAGDLLDRVFGGSASQLLMHALSGRQASKEDIEEIRRLLDAMEKGGDR